MQSGLMQINNDYPLRHPIKVKYASYMFSCFKLQERNIIITEKEIYPTVLFKPAYILSYLSSFSFP